MIYALPHNLQVDLRLKILGNSNISGKFQSPIKLLPNPQSSSREKNFISTSKSLLKNGN